MRVWELRPGSPTNPTGKLDRRQRLARNAVAYPPATIGGWESPGLPTVSIAPRIVFFIARHCSCAGGFSLVSSRSCIVIGGNFALQIDCIFPHRPPAPQEIPRGNTARQAATK